MNMNISLPQNVHTQTNERITSKSIALLNYKLLKNTPIPTLFLHQPVPFKPAVCKHANPIDAKLTKNNQPKTRLFCGALLLLPSMMEIDEKIEQINIKFMKC